MAAAERGRRVEFVVPGVPRGAGSKRAFRNPHTGKLNTVDTSGERGKDWRATIQHAVATVRGETPLLAGPLVLRAEFLFPRPAGHYGKAGLRPAAPGLPTVKPDVTKLVRALEDACNKVLWHDDAQIVEQIVTKRYVLRDEVPGVNVRVGEVR